MLYIRYTAQPHTSSSTLCGFSDHVLLRDRRQQARWNPSQCSCYLREHLCLLRRALFYIPRLTIDGVILIVIMCDHTAVSSFVFRLCGEYNSVRIDLGVELSVLPRYPRIVYGARDGIFVDSLVLTGRSGPAVALDVCKFVRVLRIA